MSLGGGRGVGRGENEFLRQSGLRDSTFTLKTAVGGDFLPQQCDVGPFLEGEQELGL